MRKGGCSEIQTHQTMLNLGESRGKRRTHIRKVGAWAYHRCGSQMSSTPTFENVSLVVTDTSRLMRSERARAITPGHGSGNERKGAMERTRTQYCTKGCKQLCVHLWNEHGLCMMSTSKRRKGKVKKAHLSIAQGCKQMRWPRAYYKV